jgi:hypothetical protein
MRVENRLWAYLCAALPGSFFGWGWVYGLGWFFGFGFLWVIWLVVGLQWVGRGILIVAWFGWWMWERWRLDLVLLRLLELGLAEFGVVAEGAWRS